MLGMHRLIHKVVAACESGRMAQTVCVIVNAEDMARPCGAAGRLGQAEDPRHPADRAPQRLHAGLRSPAAPPRDPSPGSSRTAASSATTNNSPLSPGPRRHRRSRPHIRRWPWVQKPCSNAVLAVHLDHAAADLVQLNGLEQGLEVADAETLVALALDDLEEDRPEKVFREYLQQ